MNKRILNLIKQAFDYQEKGDWDGAIEAYSKAIKINPHAVAIDAEVYNNLGIALSQKDDLDGAINAFRKAIELKPDYAGAYYRVGIILKRKGDLDNAIEAYRKAIELKPDDVATYNNLGIALGQKGNLDGAITAFRKAIELKPDYARAYYNLGIALSQKDDLDGAITAFRKATELKPDYASAYYNLGVALGQKGDWDGAIIAYRKAIELKPDYASAYYNLGIALGNKGDSDGAINAYRKAIELKPDYASAYNNLGIALKQKDDLDEALITLDKAVKLPSVMWSIHFLRGEILLIKRRYQDAVASFKNAYQNLSQQEDNVIRTVIEFYQNWALGLSAYYDSDDLESANSYFMQAQGKLGGLPKKVMNDPDIDYVTRLLRVYLNFLNNDLKLRNLFSQPDKLLQEVMILEGLWEAFSGQVKITDPDLKDVLSLLEVKRDICRLFFPATHPNSIAPEPATQLLEQIKNTLNDLKYKNTDELIRILRDNRQKLEALQPFTPALSRAGDMADGYLTFESTIPKASEKLADSEQFSLKKEITAYQKVPVRETITEESVDSTTGKRVTRTTEYVYQEQGEASDAGAEPGPQPIKKQQALPKQQIDVKAMIKKLRQSKEIDTPPSANEITLQFLNNYKEVKIEISGQEVEKVSTIQLGMVHSQTPGKPTNTGRILPHLAQNKKVNPKDVKLKDSAFIKAVKRINGELKELLGIKDDAIVKHHENNYWISNITLIPARGGRVNSDFNIEDAPAE